MDTQNKFLTLLLVYIIALFILWLISFFAGIFLKKLHNKNKLISLSPKLLIVSLLSCALLIIPTVMTIISYLTAEKLTIADHKQLCLSIIINIPSKDIIIISIITLILIFLGYCLAVICYIVNYKKSMALKAIICTVSLPLIMLTFLKLDDSYYQSQLKELCNNPAIKQLKQKQDATVVVGGAIFLWLFLKNQ